MQFLPFNKISANISKFYFFSVVLRKKNSAPFSGALFFMGYSDLFFYRSDSELVAHLLLWNTVLWQCAYIVSA